MNKVDVFFYFTKKMPTPVDAPNLLEDAFSIIIVDKNINFCTWK
jgi:hypothetical protein